MTLFFWAIWGLAGAFGYAGPRFLTGVFDPRDGVRRPMKIAGELCLALAFGLIAGMAAGPYVADNLKWTDEVHCRALAVFVGLMVNPVAPAAINLMTDFVLARLGHPLARRRD